MGKQILPSVSALFDDRVAHDVLLAAREVYGLSCQFANAQLKQLASHESQQAHGSDVRVGLTFLPPDLARRVFRQMLRDGGASCGICGGRGKLVADHCHKLQRHRGRLCHQCNTALGLMKDSPRRLRNAAMYLEEFESRFEE